MKTLVFATHNQHKTTEVRKMLANEYILLNLQDIGCFTEIAETGNSFAENAALKSKFVVENYHLDCFADDSGLEVDALNREPGIYSARYAGGKDDAENLQMVLQKMRGLKNRKARFKTVISLIQNGERFLFEGTVQGIIREIPEGTNGFGYDPIFQPDGYEQTFAQMNMEQKNEISHRAIAMKELISFLKGEAV